MQKLKTYQELDIWKIGMQVAEVIYAKTTNFPDTEKFGLVSQMRRAAVSIPSNIAEGYRRRGRGEYIQFLSYAYGSASELETQIELSRRLHFFSDHDYDCVYSVLEVLLKKINSLIRSLRV